MLQNDPSLRFHHHVLGLSPAITTPFKFRESDMMPSVSNSFTYECLTRPKYLAILEKRYLGPEVPLSMEYNLPARKLVPPQWSRAVSEKVGALLTDTHEAAPRFVAFPLVLKNAENTHCTKDMPNDSSRHCVVMIYNKATKEIEIWDDRHPSVQSKYGYRFMLLKTKELFAPIFETFGVEIKNVALPMIPEVRYAPLQDFLKANDFSTDFQTLYTAFLINYIYARISNAFTTLDAADLSTKIFLPRRSRVYSTTLLERLREYESVASASVTEGDLRLPCPPHQMRNILTGECIPVTNAESIVIPSGRVQGNDFLKDHIAKFYTKIMLYFMDKYHDMATIIPYYMVSPHPYFYALRWKYVGSSTSTGASARKRWRLITPPVFEHFMTQAMSNPSIKSIVFIVSIDGIHPTDRHSNAVFINKDQKFIERFEPNTKIGDSHKRHYPLGNGDILDDALQSLFDQYVSDYSYVPPMLTCPLGFHILDCREREESTKDKGGNCTDWSIWWMDLRLANANRPRDELMAFALEELGRGGSFRHFINGYSDFLTRISKKYKGAQRATIARREEYNSIGVC